MEGMIWKENYERKIKVLNASNGADLAEFVSTRSFKINRDIEIFNGKFVPDSCSLTIEFNRASNKDFITDQVDLKDTTLQIPILDGYNFDEELFRGWNFSTDLFLIAEIRLGKLANKGDEITVVDVLKGVETVIFKGKIEKQPVVTIRNNIVSVSFIIMDFSNEMLKVQAKQDIFYKGYCLCNNSQKSTSLLHQLAYKLGLDDTQIDFEDIVYHDIGQNIDIHTSVDIVNIEKGAQLAKEFAEACRSADAKFHAVNDKLVVRNYLKKRISTYDFDERNVLENIGVSTMDTDFSTVKVVYDRVNTKTKDILWVLLGDGGTVDDSNLTLEANMDKIGYKVDFRFSGAAVSYENPIIEVVADDGVTPVTWTDYTLDITDRGGTLHIWNSSSSRIRIKKFIIMGIGYAITKNNSTTYSKDDSKKLFTIQGNKYIQNSTTAILKAKNSWNYKCNLYKTLKFKTNIKNDLNTGDVCLFNHFDFKDTFKKVVIEKIERKFNDMTITCRQLFDADYGLNSDTLIETNLSDGDLNIIPKDVVRVKVDKPPVPAIHSVTSNVGGITIQLEDYTGRKDISTFSFELTMVDNNNEPITPGAVLVYSYSSLIVPVRLTMSAYWDKRWQVRTKAYSLQGEESDWSVVTAKCFARSLQIDSDGVAPHSITTNHLQFSNNDAMYVDDQGFLRIKADGILIGKDPDNKLIDVTNTAKSAADTANTLANTIAHEVANGDIVLNSNTDIHGQLEVFGGDRGIASFNGTTEALSTKKTIVRGGVILFYERASP